MANSKKFSRRVVARVRVGSQVYGTYLDHSDIDYRTVVDGNKINPSDPNDREVDYREMLTQLEERHVFPCEIVMAANEHILQTSPEFKRLRVIDYFDNTLAKNYNSLSILFLDRYLQRQSADHKNLMNACIFAWRGCEISKGNYHPLLLEPDMQAIMRSIRTIGDMKLADSFITLLGTY